MPWKEIDAMNQKKAFIFKAFEKPCNFTELCKQFNISTKTGYKWKQRFFEGGFPALTDVPRQPHQNGQAVTEDVILHIVQFKMAHLNWGASKLLSLYKAAFPTLKPPARCTVERILYKAGLYQKRKKSRHQTTIHIQNRFIPKEPNDLWTVDFKGWWYTPDKERCEPLTVRDAFSRFILSIKILEKADTSSVKYEFLRLFKLYGIPKAIRTDNGPPFASNLNALGLTRLAVWWVSLGIKLDRIDPGSPYQNGAHERMHRDMKRELEGKIDGNLRYHQQVFDEWREEYNTVRPHQALGNKTPATMYHKSAIKYVDEVDLIEYPRGYKSRMVNDRGWTNFKSKRIFIGNPFAGYNVGIKALKSGDFEVWFDYLFIGVIDAQKLNFASFEGTIKLVVQG
jgi:transposase InsO family protein